VPNVTPLRAEDPDRVGRYRLSGRISGMPGTGPVFLAGAVSGPEVVVRLLRGGWTRDPAERDRFAAEASSAARVPPFCAARIVDAGVVDDYAFLVSEYVAGRSLLEAVSDDGPFPGRELEALAIGSATGLASVHQAGLVHGNFGPEYVVMSASGPRVIEYGITPPYGSATPSADMLAWAQTMVFAAIGRPPATYADLDSLPADLREAAAECLSGDPALRPSARSIVLDLLGGTLPADRALPEGARRAALAARAGDQPARDLASLGAGRAGGPAGGHPGGGTAGGGHGAGRASRASGGHAGPDPAARRRSARAAPAPHRRGLVPAIVAGIVVIAVVAFVIIRVLGSAGSPGQAQDSASPPAASTSPVSSRASRSPASPGPGAITVPATFSGSWTGQARQVNPPDEFQVRLTLPPGVSDGSVAYSNASFSCVGQLSPDSVAAGKLTLDQGITKGRHTCADGTVTLTAGPDGALRFTFRGKTGPVASGTLAKS
jgi:serine/threonine protein kinase